MAGSLRRVVTGHDGEGKAVVVSDVDAATIQIGESRPGAQLNNLWRTDAMPAEINGPEETVVEKFTLHPPERGTIFRVVEFPPEDPELLKTIDGKAAFASIGAGDAFVEGARHPFMHRTETIDFAVVISGSITMLLDDSEIELAAGDTLIQRGTNHAWSNRGSEPCRVAFILVDAER
ncbi:MAG: cupin domain-containing protein [Alphaproteobacteria bacterium]|nr:cupin domain-containing protein [Alphaproteobacteria bacterium]